jgi:hypothetical protein
MGLTTQENGKDGKQAESITCYGCRNTLEYNHLGKIKSYLLLFVKNILPSGIRCAQDHHLCMECSANMVLVFLAEPKTSFPPKCMVSTIDMIIYMNKSFEFFRRYVE